MRALFIALCLLTSSIASAQTSARLELRSIYKSGAERPKFGMIGYVTHPIRWGLGVSGWLQVEEGWAEGYVGITYAPATWVELSASVGLEQASVPWRVAGSMWLGFDRFSSLTIVETGGSGPWYLSTLSVKIVDWLKAGAMIRRFDGLGPRVDITIPRTPLGLWLAYLPYDPEPSTLDLRRFAGGLSVSL